VTGGQLASMQVVLNREGAGEAGSERFRRPVSVGPVDKPHSVVGGHLSGTGVTAGLVQPTWDWASSLVASRLGLASGRG